MAENIVLISVNTYNIEGVKCVRSFENIILKEVDCLIFHSSTEDSMKVVQELSNIKGVVKKVIYISKSMSPLLYCIFMGLDADIYECEDYLQDNDMLHYLLDNYKHNTDMVVKSYNTDIDLLAKCIAGISNKSMDGVQKLVTNDFWLKTLNTAVTNVDCALTRAAQINIDVVEMLSATVQLIANLEDNVTTTSAEIENLKDLIKDMETKTRPNSITSFSSYTVPLTVKHVLYVQLVGNCKYLPTFLLMYKNYLKIKGYNAKVLLVMPSFKLYIKRFAGVPRLAQDCLSITASSDSPVYVTYEPKRMIMDAFFTKKADVYIVIDMTFNGDKLITGHGVKGFFAVGGIADVDRFKLPLERTIWSLINLANCVRIPKINSYERANEAERKSLYMKHCSTEFSKLDKVLFDMQ